uniref:SH3 domain-binding protein 5-like n=1 Tax=Angiostrongylus costaricensis TaxID=334426 RepID=A0A158PHM8_ANGCS
LLFNSRAESVLNYSELEDDDTPLDQKHLNLVHEELEKLNIATDVINKLEVQLDAARVCFREIQTSWSEKLKELSKKYSSAIAKARPYYEAKIQERKLRDESLRAAIRFERATSLLAVAKQQVALTQDSLNRQTTVHPECLEVLNHHIQRVNEAEEERLASGDDHRAISERLMALADEIRKMEKDQRSSIKKSRTYFDQRLEFTRVLERQKELILRLESEVRQKKSDYTTSLRNLERISDSIHEQRSIGGGRSAREPPANPPPYRPTAPPPYEDDDGRYLISQETVSSSSISVMFFLVLIISGDSG